MKILLALTAILEGIFDIGLLIIPVTVISILDGTWKPPLVEQMK